MPPEHNNDFDFDDLMTNWSFYIDRTETNGDAITYIFKKTEKGNDVNNKFNTAVQSLSNLLSEEGYLTMGMIYDAFNIREPNGCNHAKRMMFYTGDYDLWRKHVYESIKIQEESIKGIRGNINGFKKQIRHFNELIVREENKLRVYEEMKDSLEGLLK